MFYLQDRHAVHSREAPIALFNVIAMHQMHASEAVASPRGPTLVFLDPRSIRSWRCAWLDCQYCCQRLIMRRVDYPCKKIPKFSYVHSRTFVVCTVRGSIAIYRCKGDDMAHTHQNAMRTWGFNSHMRRTQHEAYSPKCNEDMGSIPV